MHRNRDHLKRLAVMVVIVIVCVIDLDAQPVLHGFGTRGLTDSRFPQTTIDLHFTQSGDAVVWWRGGQQAEGQWLDVFGRDIPRSLPSTDSVLRIIAVSDSDWYGARYVSMGSPRASYEIRFCRGNRENILNSSATVGWYGDNTYFDDQVYGDFLFNNVFRYEERVYAVTYELVRGIITGIAVGGIFCEFQSWDSDQEMPELLLSVGSESYSRNLSNPVEFHERDLIRVSNPRESIVTIFKRVGFGGSSESARDSAYVETLQWLDLNTGTVLDSCVIDTLLPLGLNLSPKVLPMIDGTIDLVRNDTANTKLVVDRYSVNGEHLGHFLLSDRILLQMPDPHIAYVYLEEHEIPLLSAVDYDILALDDDSRLFAWTEPKEGGGTDCFIRLFDRDWNPVGYVKRIHEDTTGRQYHPVLAAKGDTLAVAWKSNRGQSRYDSLFIRFFLRDHILDVKEEPEPPSGFQISSLWPQPARERFFMDVDVPFLGMSVTLECRDLLGRVLFRDERNATTGNLRFHRNVTRLQPGMYFLSVRSGDQMEVRKLLVE